MVPRSSQCPSIVTRTSRWVWSHTACFSRVARAVSVERGAVVLEVDVGEGAAFLVGRGVVGLEVGPGGVLALHGDDVRPLVDGLGGHRLGRGIAPARGVIPSGLARAGGLLLPPQAARDTATASTSRVARWRCRTSDMNPPRIVGVTAPSRAGRCCPAPVARLWRSRPSRSAMVIVQVRRRSQENTRWRPFGAHDGYSQEPRPWVICRTCRVARSMTAMSKPPASRREV